jgi:hypothetical protein
MSCPFAKMRNVPLLWRESFVNLIVLSFLTCLFPKRMCQLKGRAGTDWRPDVWKGMLNERILNE